jgi:hypothetical protein
MASMWLILKKFQFRRLVVTVREKKWQPEVGRPGFIPLARHLSRFSAAKHLTLVVRTRVSGDVYPVVDRGGIRCSWLPLVVTIGDGWRRDMVGRSTEEFTESMLSRPDPGRRSPD